MPTPVNVSLDEISDSVASVEGRDARLMIVGILRGRTFTGEWWRWNGNKDPEVWALAERFINNHSALQSGEELIYTKDPIHMIRCWLPDDVDGEQEECLVEGLLYSNGAVLVIHRSDKTYALLYMSEETALLFDYPMPL